MKLTIHSGEVVTCREVLSDFMVLEDERLVSERITVCRLSSNVREKLIVMNVLDQVRIGALTLEASGFVVNPKTGRLEKIGWLAV